MAKKARSREEVATLYEQHLRGQRIAAFLVHGVNALKSMSPGPEALVGETIETLEFTSETTFNIASRGIVLEVDLQRVGALRWQRDAAPWTFGQPSMPTGQLLLEGGGGVDFIEPSKTKRITFRPRIS